MCFGEVIISFIYNVTKDFFQGVYEIKREYRSIFEVSPLGKKEKKTQRNAKKNIYDTPSRSIQYNSILVFLWSGCPLSWSFGQPFLVNFSWNFRDFI